ncbi:uncharacterized protein LOC113295353 [Papaver somniferum]|uniref:uncharacterized protein LOC113295353 n=1 Tax=Papaver somniferum TaxID=3469 RepID=UPI000E702825|nr:uncharacterized protein LOC113295353 [Papaver somniferum]
MDVIREFEEHKKIDWSTNCSFISLIPKKDQVGTPQDFRSISLVNNIYKVILKVLTRRFKYVLPKMIYENRGAFISDKQILDIILIAWELVDRRFKSTTPGILCKLDIKKAFDNVRWHIVKNVLQNSGFGAKWVSWIEWCITYAQHSLLINGVSTSKFKPQKGLRHGYPLSHLLFILVAEIFSKLMKNAVQLNMISGFSVSSIQVSHLQYADGLRVNFNKSSVISIGADHKIGDILRILKCKIEKLPLNIWVWLLEQMQDMLIEKFPKKLAP